MRANNVAQTSETTGTGNLTLSATGWNGCQTLFSFFGANHRFEYTIKASNGDFEKGLGYLTDATTLVRETVIDNHLGSVAKVNFSAGSKLVACTSDVGSGIVPLVRSDGEITSLHAVSAGAQAMSLGANSARLGVFWLHRPVEVSAIGINVTTVVASSSVRLAIYQLTNVDTVNGYTFTLLLDCGSMQSATGVGNREFLISRRLGVGTYFMYTVSNGAIGVRAVPSGAGSVGLNDNGGITTFQFTPAADTGAINAAPATLVLSQPVGNNNIPRVYLKGRYL